MLKKLEPVIFQCEIISLIMAKTLRMIDFKHWVVYACFYIRLNLNELYVEKKLITGNLFL